MVGTQTLIHLLISDAAERSELERVLSDAGLNFRSYTNAQALLDADHQAEFGCVVADLRGEMHGLELRGALQARDWRLPMLLLTHDVETSALCAAAKSGDTAILARPVPVETLIENLRDLLDLQRRWIAEETELKAMESRIARLTQRESEVTMRVLRGQSSKEIAADLGISARTVEKHRASVMAKLGASNLAELCQMRRHCERMFKAFVKADDSVR